MHRFMLHLGVGMSLLAAAACGAEPTLPLAIVAARNAADLVQTLLRQRHDPNERDARGLTPLMWAARSGAVDAMAALLDGGADPDARDAAPTAGRRCSMRYTKARPARCDCCSTAASIPTGARGR